MSIQLPRIIEQFADLHVLVVGDAMLDSYLHGSTDRLCREAPVPIVAVAERIDVPGGAANTAVNIHSLGGQVTFLSAIGDDLEGQLLRHALEERGVATDNVYVQPGRRTLAKQRVLASSHLLLRFDHGDTAPVSIEVEQRLLRCLAERWSRCDVVLVSDYGYGVMTPQMIAALAKLQPHNPRILVVDSKHLTAYRQVGATAVKPNYDEAVRLLGEDVAGAARADRIAAHEQALLDLTGAQIAAVTLDTEGALIFERGAPSYRTYAQPASHAYAAGAGDTFVSAFALALGAGAHTPAAAELASAAAAIVVGKPGTTTCSAGALRACVAGGNGEQTTNGYLQNARGEVV